jgi:hypothetical protein
MTLVEETLAEMFRELEEREQELAAAEGGLSISRGWPHGEIGKPRAALTGGHPNRLASQSRWRLMPSAVGQC